MSATLTPHETETSPPIDVLDALIKADEQARQDPPKAEDPVVEEVVEEVVEDPAVADAKPAAEDDDFEKRIARLAYAEREARKQTRALQEKLDRLEGKAPPLAKDEEVDQLVEKRAAELAATKLYNDKANQIYRDGMTEYPDFETKLAGLRDLGGISPQLVEAADEIGDAHKLLHYLSRNLDEAERVMHLPAHRMGAALGKIAAKLNPVAVAAKPQSKAPPPIKPLAGKAKAEQSDETMDIAEYMRREDERVYHRRQQRR